MRKKITIALTLCNLLFAASCSRQKETPKAQPKAEKASMNAKERKETTMGVTEMTTELFKQKVMNYDKNQTDWVFEGDKPVVIDFYATWCGPCKATAPIVEELSQEYAGKIDFYKVDVDKEEELAGVFGIRSIPTFLFVPMKGKPTMQTGAMNKPQFEEIIKKVILK